MLEEVTHIERRPKYGFNDRFEDVVIYTYKAQSNIPCSGEPLKCVCDVCIIQRYNNRKVPIDHTSKLQREAQERKYQVHLKIPTDLTLKVFAMQTAVSIVKNLPIMSKLCLNDRIALKDKILADIDNALCILVSLDEETESFIFMKDLTNKDS